ncbi:MAG: Fic family protein, partial [Bacteroidales bacterium]|nr:Fic family protein [Bacteroidales bacterium]
MGRTAWDQEPWVARFGSSTTADDFRRCRSLLDSTRESSSPWLLSLACNHAFEDGNKRIGHAAMELFLVLNGY